MPVVDLVIEANAYILFVAILVTAARRGAWDITVVAACTPVLEAIYGVFGEGPVCLAAYTAFLFAALAAGWSKVAWYRVVTCTASSSCP